MAWFPWNTPNRLLVPSPRACEGLGLVLLECTDLFSGAQPPIMRGTWPGSLGTRRVIFRHPAPEHARYLAWFSWNELSYFPATSPRACEGHGLVPLEHAESSSGAQPPSMRGTWPGSLGMHRFIFRRLSPDHARDMAWFPWNAPSH